MNEPTGAGLRTGPAPNAVITAAQELSAACIKWEPVPAGGVMSDPPQARSEHASLCEHVLHGDPTMIAISLGLTLGIVAGALLHPAIRALWRSVARAVQYMARKISAALIR